LVAVNVPELTRRLEMVPTPVSTEPAAVGEVFRGQRAAPQIQHAAVLPVGVTFNVPEDMMLIVRYRTAWRPGSTFHGAINMPE